MNTNLRPLSPFQDFCVKFLGYVPSSYDDCMTYLECLIYTYNYLKNEIVPTVNTQNTVIQEMKDYIDNYFTNLDVQEEINNKLDQMALDGTLEEIITEYIQLKGLLAYDTVSDMKLADNLIDGSFVKTYGFHSLNDEGGAYYKVREVTNLDTVDEMTLIALADQNLVAELILTPTMNVKQFGAKGDGVTDDKTAIQKCIDTINNIVFPSGNYMIDVEGGDYNTSLTSGIVIGNNKNIMLDNNAYIKALPNSYQYYKVVNFNNSSNCKISGGHIYGDKETHIGAPSEFGHGIGLTDSLNITIENCDVAYNIGDCICISAINQGSSSYSENTTIRNCTLHDSRRQGISIIAAHNTKVLDCDIYNISGTNPQSGIDIESNYGDTNPVKGVTIDNCNIHDNAAYSLIVTSKTEDVAVSNCFLYSVNNTSSKGFTIDNSRITNVGALSSNYFLITNSTIYGTIATSSGGYIKLTNCDTYGRYTTTANNDEVIEIENSNITYTGDASSVFVARAGTTLRINGCTINYSKDLCGVTGENIEVRNSIIRPSANSINGFICKNFLFTNNIVENYTMYRLITISEGTTSSYITNNLFKVRPNDTIGGSSTQYIYLIGNISSTALSSTGTLTNLINTDNYTQSS